MDKFIILGSGNSHGVPMIDGSWGNCDKKNKKNNRTRCSAAIIKGSNTILIDTSPDIKKQLYDNKIFDISSVVYTHEHSDQLMVYLNYGLSTGSIKKKLIFMETLIQLNI